ncbi:hypothetical protein Tco_0344250 [Tanacetum coccineum]
MSPDQAYHSQLAYHQQQQYGFQNYSNLRNTTPQFFSQQSSQPQYFQQQSSQPPFKVPQAKDPRDGRRRLKKTGKQPVVYLDEGDDDDMAAKPAITRWNRNEKILLAETWIEHSQDANIGKDQQDDHDHVWDILKNYSKWNASEPIDKDNLQELFGPDPRERPADKQRATKKQKSVDTSSVEGSTGGSTGGSQSESVSGVLSQDYRRKCDAAEKAYEAQREKELGMLQCRELEFLLIDLSSLPPAKRAIVERKQAEIMRKYPDA